MNVARASFSLIRILTGNIVWPIVNDVLSFAVRVRLSFGIHREYIPREHRYGIRGHRPRVSVEISVITSADDEKPTGEPKES